MIHYRAREWCAALKRVDILSLTNFRVAFVIAVVASSFTAVLITVDQFFVVDTDLRYLGIESGPYGFFTSVLGLLLAFRTSQALDRFEEGISTAYEVTGGLYMAASNLVAFVQYGSASKEDIQRFQQTVTRLVSLLSAMMLSQLEGRDSLNMENGYHMMDVASLNMNKVRSLSKEQAKTEVAVQWIKTLIVDSMATGTLSIPPPILTRVFHELDISMGRHHTAAKFSQVPFPFPYAATMDMIMVFHTFLTPIVMMNLLPSSVYLPIAAVGLIQFFLWSQHLVAGELENPYDGGKNDMDLHVLQDELNEKLKAICRVDIGDVPDLVVEIDVAVSLLAKSRRSRGRLIRTAGRSKLLDISKCETIMTTETNESIPSRPNLSLSSLIGSLRSSTESVMGLRLSFAGLSRPRQWRERISRTPSCRTDEEQGSVCPEERGDLNTDELASEEATVAERRCEPEASVFEFSDDVAVETFDAMSVATPRWCSLCGVFRGDTRGSDDDVDGHMLC